MAETEKGNILVCNSLCEINEDLSVDLADKWESNFSVDLDLISISVDFECGSDFLEGGQIGAIPGEQARFSLESG